MIFVSFTKIYTTSVIFIELYVWFSNKWQSKMFTDGNIHRKFFLMAKVKDQAYDLFYVKRVSSANNNMTLVILHCVHRFEIWKWIASSARNFTINQFKKKEINIRSDINLLKKRTKVINEIDLLKIINTCNVTSIIVRDKKASHNIQVQNNFKRLC